MRRSSRSSKSSGSSDEEVGGAGGWDEENEAADIEELFLLRDKVGGLDGELVFDGRSDEGRKCRSW